MISVFSQLHLSFFHAPLRSRQLLPRLLALMLLCGTLAACASTALPPPDLFNDASFRPPAYPVDAQQALAANEAMRHYVRNELARDGRNSNPRRALADALYRKAGLQLEYDTAMTRTAAQTFEARSGNCLSLVLMTATLAREMGLAVRYQSVLGEESWSRSDGTYFVAGHVNIVLGERLSLSQDSYESDRALLIDFLPAADLTGQRTREISQATILAMYLNNRAAETMAEGNLDQAYWFARAAILHDASFTSAYNTLGLVQLRHGDLDAAQRTLAHALARAPGNTVLMSNLAQAYDKLQRHAEAAQLRRVVQALQPEPPFHFFDLGRLAMASGQYREAARLFQRELARDPHYHEFHFWLAQAHAQLGQWPQASQQLQLAMAQSLTRSEHSLYAGKLARLRALGR